MKQEIKMCPFRDRHCTELCALYISEENMCTLKALFMSFEHHLPYWLANKE